MASPSVGLYFGTENVDVISLSGSFQRPRLLNFGRVQLPPSGTWRSQVRAEEALSSGESPQGAESADELKELARSITTLLQKSSLPSKRIFVGVASEATIIRYFQMPMIPAHERKAAVAFEAKKYLPFKLEELITDFSVLTQRTDPTLMRVMFFGMKKSSVSAYRSILESMGLTPLCLEPAPASLLRLLRHTGQLKPNEVSAILSVEKDAATITIGRDNLMYLSRNVSILTPQGPLLSPAPELAEALLNETRVSIDYYRRRFLGEPAVSKVVVYGKELDERRLAELRAALELPVETGDPFRRTAGGREAPPGLAAAAGCALRGLEKSSAAKVNLLPPEQRLASEGLRKALFLQGITALVLLGLWVGFSRSGINALEQKISALQQEKIRAEERLPDIQIQKLQQLRQEEQKKLQFLKDLSKSRLASSVLLVKLAQLLPEEAWLQEVGLEDLLEKKSAAGVKFSRVLRVSGGSYANHRDQELEGVNGFLSSLKSEPLLKTHFSEFHLESVQRGKLSGEEVTQLRLTCPSSTEDLKKP
ncbi:MAG: pilus assembly protein PilM, partial [Candidatus Omnitrophica bacterium]|nr:pilus assembly protein PilM [Candidatus Omnitrophota bacterium]